MCQRGNRGEGATRFDPGLDRIDHVAAVLFVVTKGTAQQNAAPRPAALLLESYSPMP
jgi:hypothetical protein